MESSSVSDPTFQLLLLPESCPEGLPVCLLSPEGFHASVASGTSLIALLDPSLNPTSNRKPHWLNPQKCIQNLTTSHHPGQIPNFPRLTQASWSGFLLLPLRGVSSPERPEWCFWNAKQTMSLPRSTLSSGSSVHSEQEPKTDARLLGLPGSHASPPLSSPLPPSFICSGHTDLLAARLFPSGALCRLVPGPPTPPWISA